MQASWMPESSRLRRTLTRRAPGCLWQLERNKCNHENTKARNSFRLQAGPAALTSANARARRAGGRARGPAQNHRLNGQSPLTSAASDERVAVGARGWGPAHKVKKVGPRRKVIKKRDINDHNHRNAPSVRRRQSGRPRALQSEGPVARRFRAQGNPARRAGNARPHGASEAPLGTEAAQGR